VLGDFASQASIREMAQDVLVRYDRLDVLVNNAGAVHASRTVTKDGIEATFAVNHLGPFLLTNLLLDLLKRSAPARIVNVSSDSHYRGTLDFDDLGYARGGYQILSAYSRSKLANVLFTRSLARRLNGSGVTANVLQPWHRGHQHLVRRPVVRQARVGALQAVRHDFARRPAPRRSPTWPSAHRSMERPVCTSRTTSPRSRRNWRRTMHWRSGYGTKARAWSGSRLWAPRGVVAYDRLMAILHTATVTPTKLELLETWLPRQTWFSGPATDLIRVAGYRFDDPDGEVGLETLLVRSGDDGAVYQVPLSYRGAPLSNADSYLVGTMEHSVLGPRWVYDAEGDPVYRAVLASVISGEARKSRNSLTRRGNSSAATRQCT
jgi:NAD(P)-dependent dehydrogenase (short-subunit alcohol dehydrogenase family)